jgi:hypothetical protein
VPAQLVRVVVDALGQAVMAVLLVPAEVEKGRKVNAYGQSLQSLVMRRVKDDSPGPGPRDCRSMPMVKLGLKVKGRYGFSPGPGPRD